MNGVERFEYHGASLVDEVVGASVPRHLVFLHGWGANRDSLRGVATLFQHTHAVHLIDLPGFGEAPPPPAGWDTLHYTDLVQQYILERLSGSVVLIGHSFGGRISVRLAARHLAPVRAIVLMGVPGLPQPLFTRRRLRAIAIRVLRKVLITLKPLLGQGAIEWHTKRFGSKDYLAAGELRAVLVNVVNEDLTESARSIACPSLLIWGTDDTETPPWLAHRYRALIGQKALVELLPHKDHYLYTGTGAHLCGQKIRTWFEALPDA